MNLYLLQAEASFDEGGYNSAPVDNGETAPETETHDETKGNEAAESGSNPQEGDAALTEHESSYQPDAEQSHKADAQGGEGQHNDEAPTQRHQDTASGSYNGHAQPASRTDPNDPNADNTRLHISNLPFRVRDPELRYFHTFFAVNVSF
jgi:hypothetical protein